MTKRLSLLMTTAFLTVVFAGCTGGDDPEPVTASFTIEPVNDTTFLFNATSSTGAIAEYQWNFGEGTLVNTTKTKVEMEYTITNAKPTVSLVTVGQDGTSAFTMKSVTLGTGENQAPDVRLRQTPRWVAPGSDVILDAAASVDPDGDGFTTEWFFGPYIDPAPPEATFDTGVLDQDGSFDQVFDTPGVYFINCQPHPWMVGRIVVTDGANATGNASGASTLDIENFAFNAGDDFVVSAGANVTVRNLDPVGHSATTYFAAPGASNQPGEARSLRLDDLEAGDYQAHVVLDDKKPGFPATASRGIRVSEEAPNITFEEPVASGGARTSQDGTTNPSFPSALEFNATITAEATYSEGPLGADVVFRIVGPRTIEGDCAAGSCVAAGELGPGEYSFEFAVTDQDGAITSWSISVKKFVYYTTPGFGDA